MNARQRPLILCATDLRAGGDAAIAQAHIWAGQRDALLAFVHVIPEPSRTHVLFPHLAQSRLDRLPTLMSLTANAVAARVEQLTSRDRNAVEVRVDMGAPHAAIVAVAEEIGADLIVLGAGGDEEDGGPLGSVALRVVRHAHCPVLVVRQGGGEGPVLAASDLSDPEYPAIVAGMVAAGQFGAKLAVLHVAELPMPLPVVPEAGALGMYYEVSAEEHQLLREGARASLESAMSRLGVQGQAQIDEGAPAAAIVSAARRLDARLLVIGTEGRSGLRRMLLGSTAERVLRDAPCSVLVVRLHLRGAR